MIGIINAQTEKYKKQGLAIEKTIAQANVYLLATQIETLVFSAASTSNHFEVFRKIAQAAYLVADFRKKQASRFSGKYEDGGPNAYESLQRHAFALHIQREEFIYNLEKQQKAKTLCQK